MSELMNTATTAVQERTIEIVTAEIRAIHKQVQRMALGYAIEIGRRLCEAKEMLPHGEWGAWLETETSYSKSTANNLMRIFNEYGASQMWLFEPEAKSQTLGDLPYTKALKLLALPEDEREQFAQEHDVQQMSTRELDKAIRERDEAQRAAKTEKELREKECRETERLRTELDELKKRPVEVVGMSEDAVQRLVQQAVTEEKNRQEGELLKLKEQLKRKETALEEEKKRAEQSAQKKNGETEVKLENALADLQKAKEEAARLEKKLAAADSVTSEFAVRFETARTEANAMRNCILKLEEQGRTEQAGKLRTALRAFYEAGLKTI